MLTDLIRKGIYNMLDSFSSGGHFEFLRNELLQRVSGPINLGLQPGINIKLGKSKGFSRE